MDDERPQDDDFIAALIREILQWKNKEPSVVLRALGYATAPIAYIVRKLIPASAILAALTGFDWVAKNTLANPGSLDSNDFQPCDRYAGQVINFHIGVAMTEGGAAGFFGLPAMVVDVPAIIWLAMRTVRQIGCEYGYGANTDEEQQFVFSVMACASANSQEEKLVAMAMSAFLINLISKNTWKALAEKAAVQPIGGAAAVIGVKQLAKQLGINITKRSALVAIPVIGAAVGSGVNGWFIRDVGNAAQILYQERWLRDRDLWPDQPEPRPSPNADP